MWRCKKCKSDFDHKPTCGHGTTERISVSVPVTAAIARWYRRHHTDFRGKGKHPGWRNQINQSRAHKNQRSPLQHGTDMLAAMFRQIFGHKIRSVKSV